MTSRLVVNNIDNDTGVTTIRLNPTYSSFELNGAERIRITNNTRVGIVTDNPATPLHIQSTSPVIRLTDSNQAADNKNWNIAAGTSNILRIQAINDAGTGGGSLFDFYRSGNNINEFRGMKGGAAWFVVDNVNKEVGIGTDNPTTTLQLGEDSNEATLSLYNAGTKKSALQASSNFGTILYSYDDEPLIFSTNSGSGFNEKMRILESGRIGIGTTVPDRMLHIKGTGNALVKMEGDYSGSVTGIEGVLTASGANRYVTGVYGKVVNTSGSESNVASIRLWNEQASPTTSDSPGYITFNTPNDGASTATEKLRITSTGQINSTSTESIRVPKGTTAQRPTSPVAADVRWNTTTSSLEGRFSLT